MGLAQTAYQEIARPRAQTQAEETQEEIVKFRYKQDLQDDNSLQEICSRALLIDLIHSFI